MEKTLNFTMKILAFADQQATNEPRLRHADWLRNITGVAVNDARSQGFRVSPGAVTSVFSTLNPTTLDGTTTFDVALLPSDPSTYRFSWTGGTNPTLRTGRNLTPTGMTLTFTSGVNGLMSVASSAPLFGSVVAGDFIFVPGVLTGDPATTVSPVNCGYWKVVSVVDTQHLTMSRPDGEPYQGATQTATIVSNSHFRAFSSAGVQVGDSVTVTSGFADVTQTTFTVSAVTDGFFEVVSTTALPDQTGIIPTAAGMVFYSGLKRFLFIETDQEVSVRLNGDTSDRVVVQPVDPSDESKPGVFLMWGPVWSLQLASKSSAVANVTVIHCE